MAQASMLKIQKHIYRLKRLCHHEELKLLMDVSHCNLRCALCPRGGASGLKNEAKGLMSFDLFKKIIDKFKEERVEIRELEIGNWGEPLLNPDLPKIIRYVMKEWPPKYMGKPGSIGISTNLTCLTNPEELLQSGVNRIRVSISGMTQETYSKNHIGGNIKTVLENVLKLVHIKSELNLKHIEINVGFHDLIYNKNEAIEARQFCADHNISFTLLPMYISSVEENVILHQQKDRMVKHYSQFIDINRELATMKTAKRADKCQYRRSVIVISFNGDLVRCCGVYGSNYFMGSVFDYKIRDVTKIKSPICELCIKTPMSWR